MSRVLLLAIGLGLALLGVATAFDVISLRAVAHSLNVPLLSALVIGLREAMPASLAHAIEPAVGMLGAVVIGWPITRRLEVRPKGALQQANSARTSLNDGARGARSISTDLSVATLAHSEMYRSLHWSPVDKLFVRVFVRNRIHSGVVTLMNSS